MSMIQHHGKTARYALVLLLSTLACLPLVSGRASAQTLETETARLLSPGVVTVSGGYEFQTSSDGREIALPLAFEVGLGHRLELLAEPVPYTSIRPTSGRNATGAGDLEVTMTYLARQERGAWPALALAGEVKVPTARDQLIGTGKSDYALYLIGSTTRGRFSTHANVGYAILGKPAGVVVHNIFNFALAEEVGLTPTSHLFGEVLGSTASGAGEGEKPAPGPGQPIVTSEIAGAQLVGTVGVAQTLFSSLELSMSVSLDNNAAVLLRPGFTYRIR